MTRSSLDAELAASRSLGRTVAELSATVRRLEAEVANLRAMIATIVANSTREQ